MTPEKIELQREKTWRLEQTIKEGRCLILARWCVGMNVDIVNVQSFFSHFQSCWALLLFSKQGGSRWKRYYRKRGSASYIVREWLLWVVERERETPVTSSISRWNREWSCIWLPRQRVDPMHMHTRRRVLSLHLLSTSSARSAWQAKTTNSNSCDRAVAQVKYRSTYPNNLGEGTASTEEISKKGIKLILKTIGNRKGDCAWSCSRGQTQPEKICKLQSTNQ